jgi:hypothetical protein
MRPIFQQTLLSPLAQPTCLSMALLVVFQITRLLQSRLLLLSFSFLQSLTFYQLEHTLYVTSTLS